METRRGERDECSSGGIEEEYGDRSQSSASRSPFFCGRLEPPSYQERQSSIAAVASIIQERARQLLIEHSALEFARTEVQNLQQILFKEQDENLCIKRTMLVTTRSCMGVDLEKYCARDKIKGYKKSIEQVKQEVREVLEEHDGATTKFEESSIVFSNHGFHQMMYQHVLTDHMMDHEDLSNRKRTRREMLDEESFRFEQQTKVTESQVLELEQQIKKMKEVSTLEDARVSLLASEVRESLAKRTTLRQSLRKAQETHNKANENMSKWEQEFISVNSTQ